MGYRCTDISPTSSSLSATSYILSEATSNITNNSYNHSTSIQYNTCNQVQGNTTIACHSFEYNSTVYRSTIVSEFGLVCKRAWITTSTNVFFMLVRIPAGFMTGQFIDRLGRKKTIMVGLLLLGCFGLGTAYAVNVEMYIIFRCLSAIPIIGIWDSCATLLSEVTTPSKRPPMLIGMIYSWSAGIILLSGLGYWLRDWRTLQMAISIPSFALLIAAYWMYDESPHWLYSQARYKEAQLIIDKITRWNNISSFQLSLPENEVDNSKINEQFIVDKSKLQLHKDAETAPQKNGCLQILHSRRFLAILAVCAFGWLACNMGYSGLAFGLGSLAGDVYINNLISAGTEIVSYCLCFLVIPGGRKIVYVILLAVGGIALIASAVIQDVSNNFTWLVILTTMIGRLSMSAGWQILYIWCIELFPTTVRVTMLEVSMIVGHVGSAVSPLINDLHKLIKNPAIHGKVIAPAVYGVLLIVSSLLALYLPETNNKALPVNIEEAASNISLKKKGQTEKITDDSSTSMM